MRNGLVIEADMEIYPRASAVLQVSVDGDGVSKPGKESLCDV